MLEQMWQSFISLPGYLLDANKRIYLPYLLSAVVMAVPVYFAAQLPKRSMRGFLQFLFPKNVWLCKSARLDYGLLVSNVLLKAALFAPIVLTMVPVAIATTEILEWCFGQPLHLPWPESAVIAIFTLMLFIVDDLTRFLLHLLLHKVAFFWEFHKVHHSAKVLTPFTIYRSHPVESYLYACRMALTQGLVVGLGYHFFGTELSMYDILGANAFVFLFNIFGANLRHSHIRFTWGDWLEGWFISPAQHQIHHSDNPQHFDTNLGSALAIWDRMYGSLIKASAAPHISIGVGQYDAGHDSLTAIYLKPFKQACLTLLPNKRVSKQPIDKLD
ncbi:MULTISPECIES: sterol desaturase family protein [Pseudoalteromonas]|uniref:Fatty acid hydroxylase n=1 Tax=Pseudoalteromonas amylolytica TaxID=1859457 RepID=A0A1S1MVU6_9GAMM|nr:MULTISPECIES: sterol desaturase family protein [Pseudoalteromonas]OHU87691.1 fatty acid hydroxylase [Pseudoalteromonas sp. JW3]OHU91133.1 fatty acid hydroxylase [Pseudoalteromonas amylolytica]